MPRKKFDKASSTTFQVVHRPQNDPKIHDESANSAVFKELAPPQARKIKSRRDLESELFSDTSSNSGEPHIRENEGQAAEYGIYYDDTDYDYMQHIRDLDSGAGDGEAFFVEAKTQSSNKKGKGKVSLEEALQNSSLSDEGRESGNSAAQEMLREDAVASSNHRQTSYQDQQDIPDALAGFQPDMDPRLREVLEALEDDAYVDDEEDFFAQIADDGEEITKEEFGLNDFPEDEDDGGWESDATERPRSATQSNDIPMTQALADESMSAAISPPPPDTDAGDWMKDFRKFKSDQKLLGKQAKPVVGADLQSSIVTGGSSVLGGRRKKRKGALTSSAGYSMTSSSLARTEGQSLLDARFDKMDEMYGEDDEMGMEIDDSASMVSKNTASSVASKFSNATGNSHRSNAASQAPDLSGAEFGSLMDDFLGSNTGIGKGVKRKGRQGAMAELDEIRSQLGPARIKAQKAS